MGCHKKVGEKHVKIKDEISGYDKDVLIKTYRLPSGVLENFFVDDNNDSVQILAICEDGMVLTVKQFRPGLEKDCVELPGGGLEPGEDPKEAAVRELIEETGFQSGTMTFLGKVPYSPYSTGFRYMFVADGCERVSRLNLDENEFLKVIKWPMERFREEIKKGGIRGTDCAYAGLDQLNLL